MRSFNNQINECVLTRIIIIFLASIIKSKNLKIYENNLPKIIDAMLCSINVCGCFSTS